MLGRMTGPGEAAERRRASQRVEWYRKYQLRARIEREGFQTLAATDLVVTGSKARPALLPSRRAQSVLFF